MTSAQAAPTQPLSTALTQAVLAEPNPRFKDPSRADITAPSAPAPGQSKAEASPVAKNLRSAEGSVVLPDSVQVPVKVLPAAMPIASEQVGGSGATKPTTQTALNAEWLASLPEALAAKGGPEAPAPIVRAADGTALAALTAGTRPVETPAAAAPAPAPAPPRSAPMLQVEGGVRWMLKGGVQEAQLQLHPESLGQVTIHLRVEGGEVHARLWITDPASVQAVQEGRPHLEMSLKEQGLQLGSFDLQQGHRPQQETPATPMLREQPVPDAPIARQEAPAAIYPTSLNPHHVELYA